MHFVFGKVHNLLAVLQVEIVWYPAQAAPAAPSSIWKIRSLHDACDPNVCLRCL